MGEVQTMRCDEIIAEVRLKVTYGQTVEYAAAIVVEQHDRDRYATALHCEQAVEVMIQGDIAQNSDQRLTAPRRANAQSGRDIAVDAGCAAICPGENWLVGGDAELIEMADRQTVAGKERAAWWNEVDDVKERGAVEIGSGLDFVDDNLPSSFLDAQQTVAPGARILRRSLLSRPTPRARHRRDGPSDGG